MSAYFYVNTACPTGTCYAGSGGARVYCTIFSDGTGHTIASILSLFLGSEDGRDVRDVRGQRTTKIR
ncbi:hypothetical protein ABE44_33105 [Bacillus thuringiensis]|nr:hypothetical protein [Bacillus thuringiensis]MBG9504235.1 hypothetical protein [Bacillus thuringiensis]